MTREEAATMIQQSELSAHAGAIIEKLLPSILIRAKRTSLDGLPTGASRMGGVPDIPEDFAWPRWTGSQLEYTAGVARRTMLPERNLDFIAQLNLEELKDLPACKDLPAEGMLYFFYDIENQPWGFDPADHLGSRVIFIAKSNKPLIRRNDLPHDPKQSDTQPCKLVFAEEWTIPDWGSYEFEHEDGPEIIDELKQDICGAKPNYWVPVHRLFGWPEQIQNEMRLQCNLIANGICCGGADDDSRMATLKGLATDWLLLLQVDTDDENPDWMWGDVGRIYYWIHRDDLANRRFENVRLILQCS